MSSDEFQCAICRGVFTKGWSDEEAKAEARELFGEHRDDDGIVCDVCFRNLIVPDMKPSNEN